MRTFGTWLYARATVNFKAGTEGNSKTKRTNSDGMATLSGSSTRFIEYGAGKEGYYPTSYEKSYTEFTGITGFRRWQPWNETITLVLHKNKVPTALHIGNHQGERGGAPLKLPGKDKSYGYDLIVGDWVAPYGKGVQSDFIFNVVDNHGDRKKVGREYDYTLYLTFSNEGDGIQRYDAHPIWGSRLRLPHNAPLDGYSSSLVQRKARKDDRIIHYDFPEDRNYYFRVRTRVDNSGRFESALYGKIYGNIKFSQGNIGMLYYLNPNPNDRNLEADYKKNLFPSKQKYGFTEYPP